MRIGQNPAKSVRTVTQPEDVTVAILNYIPTMGGYYAQSLEVLEVCLNSVWENTQIPYDLMVFDNGSCPPVREFLQDAQKDGKIQFLVLSEKNYGKAGAWNFIFNAAPGKYIAYADGDVFHHPGWLEPQIRLLEKYQNTGMVTGMPMWTPEEFSTATISWAEQSENVILMRGKYLDWEDYWKHSRSLGADEKKARDHYETIESLVVKDHNNQLFVGAAHFQFVASKAVLQEILPIPSERPMGEVRMLDIALNEAGYLRFCTPDWWVEHMGNRIDSNFTQGSENPVWRKKRTSRLWKRKFPRRVVSWLYHTTFEILYKE